MSNHLAQETSPYLQQHANNPVHWYPWGKEALSLAQQQNKPILLSIGYSACHWCHVMAHESFEDDGIAAIMNRHFINIKVDREERPDLDYIYQLAHQMLTQRGGGWPLTMFLTSDGKPFFGGTYFPKTPRYNLPGFGQLIEHVAQYYAEHRDAIDEQNMRLLAAFQHTSPTKAETDETLQAKVLDQTAAGLLSNADRQYGGFGGAPKFPHPTDLEFLLRQYARTKDMDVLHVPAFTLEKMVLGGIYGGFFTPTEAGAIGALGALVLMLLRGRFTAPSLMTILLDTGKACASIFCLLITAQMYSRMLTLSRLPETLTTWASALDVPGLVILLAFIAVLLILGCIIDSVSILLLTMPIMVPIALTIGYDKVWFGMIAIVAIELGLLTPPFGMVVFAMKASLPPDVRVEEIFLGAAPFFVVLLVALALVIAFPQISLFIPRLLLG